MISFENYFGMPMKARYENKRKRAPQSAMSDMPDKHSAAPASSPSRQTRNLYLIF
jgi:hypothetical protein